MRGSLTVRLLFSTGLVLGAFFGIAGLVLENAFIRGVEEGARERLQVHIYTLLSAADMDLEGKLKLPRHLPVPRFSTPGSGLYGAVFNAEKEPVWWSNSAIGTRLEALSEFVPGQTEFRIDSSGRFVLSYPLLWEDEAGSDKKYLFVVAEDSDAVEQEIAGFSGTLWRWLGGTGLLLVFVQVGVLGWSLRPLRVLAKDIEAIEAGNKLRLDETYPRELQGVTTNMNALLDSERGQMERYRNSLSNLAHSLKTPLAILRGCGNDRDLPTTVKHTLGSQISRIDELIEYQLQRAAARGKKRLTRPIEVVPVIEKLLDAVQKVYASKNPKLILKAEQGVRFACEEGDLLEIAGNLIDNACKWCRSTVIIRIEYALDPPALHLSIEDDGPGIPGDKLDQVLRRGVRADEQIQGHGIGLAVVYDLIQFSEGRMESTVSELGGLRWDVRMPGRVSVN